jgi:predicted RNase H-like HicB family nuclease
MIRPGRSIGGFSHRALACCCTERHQGRLEGGVIEAAYDAPPHEAHRSRTMRLLRWHILRDLTMEGAAHHPEFTQFGVNRVMKTKCTYWKESDGRYLGYLNDYPDHWTQGEDLEDLKEHLRDLFELFSSETIPGIKKVEEIEVG